MPLYDYRCRQCDKRFEIEHSIYDDPKPTCLDCSGDMIRLISGGVGIAFKGTGFYVNDCSDSSSSQSQEVGSETTT